MVKNMRKILAAVICVTVVLASATSCVSPAVSPTDKKDLVTDIKDKTFVVDDWTYTGEKKTEMTLDDFCAVVEECKALYAASPRIDYSVNGGEAGIRDRIDVSDVSKISSVQYKQYLEDILTMVSYRLSDICDQNLCFDETEWRQEWGYEEIKNSLIYIRTYYTSDPLDSTGMTRKERLKRMAEEYDEPSFSLYYGYGGNGTVFYSAVYYPGAGADENEQYVKVFPSVEEEEILSEIRFRETAANPDK